MAPRTLRKALGAVKDQTSIGLAKVASSGAPDLDVAVVKATSHDDVPTDDKYVQEIIHLTSYSRGYVNACVTLLAKRLSKTHNWIVALKTLTVIHRLLREGDSTFEDEFIMISRRVLDLSGFRDESHSNAWDFSAFVRTYAMYLDERLDCFIFTSGHVPKRGRGDSYKSDYDDRYSRNDYRSDSRNGRSDSRNGRSDSRNDYRAEYNGSGYEENGRRHSPEQQNQNKVVKIKDMKPDVLLEKLPSLQNTLERVLACRPTGAARHHRLTHIALYTIVKESYQLYADICDGITILLDGFFDMEHADSVKVFDIYARSAKQAEDLSSFYGICKNIGVGRTSDYPTVQKIAQDHLDTLEDYLRDRSRSSRPQRSKSPEPAPVPKSPEREAEPEPDYNTMKALPAPPVESQPQQVPQPAANAREADLLDLSKANISADEHQDSLALALFSTPTTQKWETFGADGEKDKGRQSEAENGKAGWELALVEEASKLSNVGVSMTGGFNSLLLDSMYDQATVSQKVSAAAPAGSASSVAMPGRPASSVLALPAPVATIEEDPFAASATVPPPPYVQMADMRQKQQLLNQEQQMWQQYQQDGMQGYYSLARFYNNPAAVAQQQYMALPYQGMGYGVSHSGFHY